MLTTTHPNTALRFAHETIEAHHREVDRDRAGRCARTGRRTALATRRRGAPMPRPTGALPSLRRERPGPAKQAARASNG